MSRPGALLRSSPATGSAGGASSRNTRSKQENKVDNDSLSEILREIASLKNIVSSSAVTIIELKAEIEQLKVKLESSVSIKELESVNKNITSQINKCISKETYADKLKKCDPVVVIVPKCAQSSNKTKNDFKSQVTPSKISFKNIRNAANGGVIIECQDKESQELLKNSALKKLSENYNINLPTLRNPRFKVINICDKTPDETVILNIKTQNHFVSKDATFKIVKMFENNRDNRCTYSYIIETDPKTFSAIIENEKLNIGWDRCKVFEHIYINRCYQCLGFNHKSNDCTKTKACMKCGGEHNRSECTSEAEICVNCKWAVDKLKLQLNIHHQANDKACYVLQKKIESARKSILQSQ